MNFQSIRVVVEPDPARGRVGARLEPPLSGLTLVNRVRLTGGRCGGFQRGVSVQISGDSDNRVELGGTYSRNCKIYSIPPRAHQPRLCVRLVRRPLARGRGELSGRYRRGSAPDDAEPWLEFKSEFASQAVRFMNKHSNNVMARQLLLTLGAETYGPPASLDKARRAAAELLRRKGLDCPAWFWTTARACPAAPGSPPATWDELWCTPGADRSFRN